jgi:hypothetical protein
MIRRLPILSLALAAACTAVSPALAQSVLQVSVAAGGNVSAIAPGGSLALAAADIGQPVLANTTVRYSGAATATITGVSVTGTTEMTLLQAPSTTPINPGGTANFTVQYLSVTGNAVAAQVSIAYTENGQAGTFTFTLTGTSPRLTVSYYFAPGGALTDINSGDRITFPATNIGSIATAVVTVLNRGSAAGTLQSVTLSGPSFQLANSPAPANLPPGSQVSFNVVFSPATSGGSQGLLVLGLPKSNASFSLTGSGTTPGFSTTYTLSDGNVRTLTDGAVILFPGIDINTTTTANIEILNQGTGSGTVSTILVSGNGFRLTGVPLLPATVAAGQSLRFGIVFAPTQAGAYTGSFRIDMTGGSITSTLNASTNSSNITANYTLSDGVSHSLVDGTAITFPSVDINGTSTATIDVSNQGTGSGSVSGIFLSGAGFRLSGTPQLPATVAAGQSLRFSIVFAPTQSGSYTGSFRIDLTGRSISGTLTASTAAATMSLAYVDPDTSNVVPLSAGGTLTFPNTVVNASTTITFQVANSGAGTGSITSVTLGASSPAFQLVSLPSLPLSVPPAQQARFGVRFSPTQQQTLTATLVVVMNNQTFTINLQAQGVGPQFTYTYGSGGRAVAPGGTLTVDDTTVGQTTSVVITMNNAGSGDGVVPALAVTGTGFTITDAPAVPFTVKSGAMQHFTLSFAPTQPGPVNGRLTVGSDSFTVTGTGIGSRLIFTYTNASSVVPVTDGGVVLFPPAPVGNSQTLDFTVQNTGTSAAPLSSITLAAPSAVFALQKLPALPMNLDAGATVGFTVSFSPNNIGSLTATMRVNNSSFTLSGTGTQPAPLPSYQFQAPSGSAKPAQQPAVGLTFAAPYSLALQGTLKLNFITTVFADDPSVQFSNGSRTVNFTIPANSTKAVFDNGGTTVALQTGTTAGDIVITPSFSTSAGLDLTPTTPDTLTFTIPRAAPEMVSATISAQTLTSFTVLLSGYSTTRSVRQLDITITPKSGNQFTASHLTLDVTAASASWFQSTASQPFGGTFLIAVPFVLQNGGSTTDDLVRRLQSLSITATNDVGTSGSVTVTIP